jgi:subtilase family serine protease
VRPLPFLASALIGLGILLEAGCAATSSLAPKPAAFAPQHAQNPMTLSAMAICQSQNDPGSTQCGSLLNLNFKPNPNKTVVPTEIPGYQPADLQNAYGLAAAAKTKGKAPTIAIVTAYLEATSEVDLAIYRAAFGLPLCTQLNGCFNLVQMPGLALPDAGWATETDLDIEMVSALCPQCKILVVAAPNAKVANLAAAVDRAAQLHADAISNSYAAVEDSANASYESHYHHTGTAIVAGAGDTGYGTVFPATSPHVTAVGGTTLTRGSGGWQQTVWPLTGSGCSAYFAKPAWQHDSGCAMRTANDTAAVADPNTGVAVWSLLAGGWVVIGGTSVGAPIVATTYALAGNTKKMQDASGLYKHAGMFGAITGSNGDCGNYLCNAGPGYNGPAGLGVFSGTGAF